MVFRGRSRIRLRIHPLRALDGRGSAHGAARERPAAAQRDPGVRAVRLRVRRNRRDPPRGRGLRALEAAAGTCPESVSPGQEVRHARPRTGGSRARGAPAHRPRRRGRRHYLGGRFAALLDRSRLGCGDLTRQGSSGPHRRPAGGDRDDGARPGAG
jgi:hypothetical protein